MGTSIEPSQSPNRSRRRFLRLTVPATMAALTGFLETEDSSDDEANETEAPDEADPDEETVTDRDAVVTGIKEHAIPLEGADPSLDLTDLEPLTDVFEDVSIVGMGEATHGTREFFQLKHRLLQFLVTELDYRIFAWEADFSDTLAVDEYVRTGEGDPKDALELINYWFWDTEEVLAMIEWLRDFNDGRDPDDKVRFYGFDTQDTSGPASALIEFLSDVDPYFLKNVRETLDLLADEELASGYQWEPDEREEYDRRLEATEHVIATLEKRFRTYGFLYAWKTSKREVQLAVQQLRALEQAVELIDNRLMDWPFDEEQSVSETQIREGHMAENVSWILDYEKTDEMALWAHNNHVKRGEITADNDALGEYIHQEFGEQYYPLGFDFGRGSFQFFDILEGGIAEHTIDKPAPDTASAVFSATDLGTFALDVETAMDDPAVRDWATEPQSIKDIGTLYEDADTYSQYDLSNAFDGLIFVEETSRAVPIERE